MDLLEKSIIAVVVLVAIFGIIYYLIVHFGISQSVTESQAVSLVLSDIKNTNPNAVVNVTNVTPSQFPGSWHILLTVIYNATSPCPSFYALSFDYPKYGFVSRVENNYTSNCIVHGLANNPNYIIAAAPVAITRIYSFPAAQEYIHRFGYSNVSASALFYKNASVLGKNYTSVWEVTYTSPTASYSEKFYITQVGGNLIANYSIPTS
ncbi:MAG: hypothetical protein ACP5HW_02325 [Candidatus Micrarchaeia archaeon]